jgi:hypothetical protein
MEAKSDYETSGFDAFLSRSIDDVSQVNLDSQGPQTNAIRYDDRQVDGMLGDTLQIGKIRLNGSQGNITGNDGGNDFFLLGDE